MTLSSFCNFLITLARFLHSSYNCSFCSILIVRPKPEAVLTRGVSLSMLACFSELTLRTLVRLWLLLLLLPLPVLLLLLEIEFNFGFEFKFEFESLLLVLLVLSSLSMLCGGSTDADTDTRAEGTFICLHDIFPGLYDQINQ